MTVRPRADKYHLGSYPSYAGVHVRLTESLTRIGNSRLEPLGSRATLSAVLWELIPFYSPAGLSHG